MGHSLPAYDCENFVRTRAIVTASSPSTLSRKQRLGVGGADVEPPGVAGDSEPVERVLGSVGMSLRARRGRPARPRRCC